MPCNAAKGLAALRCCADSRLISLDVARRSANNRPSIHSTFPLLPIRRCQFMRYAFLLTAVATCVAASTSLAGEITGQYVEARTCDIYTGPCFANADTGLTGKHAVMAWKIDKGSLGDVKL